MPTASRRIRIGFVIGQLTYGGAERQLYELARGIDRERFECFVYCLSDQTAPYGDLLKSAGVEPRVVGRRGHFDLGRVFRLAQLLRRDRIDIVSAYLVHANGYAWLARSLAGAPRLVTSARNCRRMGFARDLVNRLAFRMSDAIVCNGEAVGAFIAREYRAPAGRSVVIHNGVDLGRFGTPGDHPPPAGSRSPTVITVGRLVPQKDLGLFLESADLVLRREPRVRFQIVGDGPLRRSLAEQATRLGLADHVCFLGERDDIPGLLQEADVFWLTSAWEGFPNVVLEAMACGKPVVARDVGACREAVCHGTTGYLVSTRDAAEFAAHTLGLLGDPVRARAMGEAGRQLTATRFSVPTMIRATEALYDSLPVDAPAAGAAAS